MVYWTLAYSYSDERVSNVLLNFLKQLHNMCEAIVRKMKQAIARKCSTEWNDVLLGKSTIWLNHKNTITLMNHYYQQEMLNTPEINTHPTLNLICWQNSWSTPLHMLEHNNSIRYWKIKLLDHLIVASRVCT